MTEHSNEELDLDAISRQMQRERTEAIMNRPPKYRRIVDKRGREGVELDPVDANKPYKATITNITNNSTIDVPDNGIVRITPQEDVTGIILAPGHRERQGCVVINESRKHRLSFADPDTSNVADVAVIPPLSAQHFTWDAAMEQWYKEFDPWFFSHRNPHLKTVIRNHAIEVYEE